MKKIGFIMLALLALGAGIAFQNIKSTTDVKTFSLSKTALMDVDGTLQNLSQWQGKILIINFWATWCPPCLTEIPDFIRLQTQYKSKNVQFIGIALDNLPAVKAYHLKAGINYPLLMAENSGIKLAHSWGNLLDVVPFTVVINPQGEIVHRQIGEFHSADIEKVLEPLLNLKKP
ncbi:MAG: TlpA family protein disulfide reductase [Methylococcales bacterium]|nr:TlpA family protein disulfide reductase [Methylococcales bacterium]